MAQPDTNIQNAPTPPKQPKYPLDTIPPSTKRKRSQFSRSPPTPCRGPNTQLPDIPLLETSPLSTTDTNFPPFHAQVQAVTASAHNSSASQSDTGDASISASIRSTDHDGQMRRLDAKIAHQHALREGPHDLPPIAVLHGTSVSVGGQSRSPSLERLGMYILPPNATVRQVKDEQPTAPTSGPLPKSAGPHLVSARASGHGIFGSAHRWPSYAPNTSSASGAPAPYTIPAARTRAETGASSHEPTPRYTYGAQLYRQNSLMRRAPPPHAPQGAGRRASQAELDAVCAPDVARVGVLGRPLALEPGAAAVAMAAIRERERETGVDGMKVDGGWWMRARENTAPTQQYTELLEATFGAGSFLRGEGAKPVDRRQNRSSAGAGRGRSISSGTGRSISSPGVDTDVDMEGGGSARYSESTADEDGEDRRRGVRDWIAEIQAVVKGKKRMSSEDIKSLADTMKEIADMDATEGYALGEDGVRLRRSIKQLAQLEEIPFEEEYRVKTWARRLLKHWPAI